MSENAEQFVIKMSAPQNMNIGTGHEDFTSFLPIQSNIFIVLGVLITKGRGVEKNGSIFVRASPRCQFLMKQTECEEKQDKADCSGTNSPPYSAPGPKLKSSPKCPVLLGVTILARVLRMMQTVAGALWHSVSGSPTRQCVPTSLSIFARWVKIKNLWWTNDNVTLE